MLYSQLDTLLFIMYLLVSGMVSPYCGTPADKIQMLSSLMLLAPGVVGYLAYQTGSTYMQWSHNMQISPISVKELFSMVITADGNPIQGGLHCCSS